MDNKDFSHLFQNDLLNSEKILWTGTPEISFLHYLRIRIVPVGGLTIFMGFLILSFLVGLSGDNSPEVSRLIFIIIVAMILLLVAFQYYSIGDINPGKWVSFIMQ